MGHSHSTLVQCHGSLPRISSFTWRDLRSKSGGAQTCNLQINVLCSLPGLCQTVTETTVWVNPHNTILRAGGSLMVSKRALWALSSSKEISDHQPEYNSKMLQKSLITVWKMKRKKKTHPQRLSSLQPCSIFPYWRQAHQEPITLALPSQSSFIIAILVLRKLRQRN